MSAVKFAEGYIKPKESFQSDSARKRASIRALGSITYLQKYYASGGTACEEMLDNDVKVSFVDLISPRSGLMPPSTDVLLRNCHEDIQSVLEVWGIISYPSSAIGDQGHALDSPAMTSGDDESYQLGHAKDLSSSSLNTRQQRRYDSMTVDMLALLESSTKAIASIRTYSIYAPGLSFESLAVHRQAALDVIEMLSVLEQENRIHLDEDNGNNELGHLQEYNYASLTFGDLEPERIEMKKYLAIAQEQLFKPQAENIETELHQLLVADPTDTTLGKTTLPRWIRDDQWDLSEDGMPCLDRCHDFIQFFSPGGKEPLPSPSTDKEGFLDALSDGYMMSMVFNAFIRLTNMPFGYVDKINEDTFRLWRAAENWRFLLQACKFRLEFKVPEGSFTPLEIVKRTETGREQLQLWVRLIVERGIQEAKEALENRKPPAPIAPNMFPDF
ncbi:hypothetical protein B0O80DRAFT_446769 [Mortierella sp. GBAus27b]|nr:hypothetical protein BGX31_000729 [Mortierella sp. GBA43]KAI8357201.1 hypothetical protein B0O80DRAFT_446769 [Mortierella sp. GBAus27b]